MAKVGVQSDLMWSVQRACTGHADAVSTKAWPHPCHLTASSARARPSLSESAGITLRQWLHAGGYLHARSFHVEPKQPAAAAQQRDSSPGAPAAQPAAAERAQLQPASTGQPAGCIIQVPDQGQPRVQPDAAPQQAAPGQQPPVTRGFSTAHGVFRHCCPSLQHNHPSLGSPEATAWALTMALQALSAGACPCLLQLDASTAQLPWPDCWLDLSLHHSPLVA